METCYNYSNENNKDAFFSSDEKKYIKLILRLKEEHPNDINIIRYPEENFGTIYCTIPRKYFKIKAPKQISEEQRKAAGERLKKSRVKNNVIEEQQ